MANPAQITNSINTQPRRGGNRNGRPAQGHEQGADRRVDGQVSGMNPVERSERCFVDSRFEQPEQVAPHSLDRSHPAASAGAVVEQKVQRRVAHQQVPAQREEPRRGTEPVEPFEVTVERLVAVLEGTVCLPEATAEAICGVHDGRCGNTDMMAVGVISRQGRPSVVAFCRKARAALARVTERPDMDRFAHVFRNPREARRGIDEVFERRRKDRQERAARRQYEAERAQAKEELGRAILAALGGEADGFLPPASETCNCGSKRFCGKQVFRHIVVEKGDGTNIVMSLCGFADWAFWQAFVPTGGKARKCQTLEEAKNFVAYLARRANEKRGGQSARVVRRTGATQRKRDREHRAHEERVVVSDLEKQTKVRAAVERHNQKECRCNGVVEMECARALRLLTVIELCGTLGVQSVVRE